MRQTSPPLPLHRRASSDLALPPSCSILRHVNKRAFSLLANHGLPNRHLFRPRRRMALLASQSPPYSNAVQEDPQTTSPIQCAVWSGRRVCFSNRSYDPSFRLCRHSRHLVCCYPQFARTYNVHVDRPATLPGN